MRTSSRKEGEAGPGIVTAPRRPLDQLCSALRTRRRLLSCAVSLRTGGFKVGCRFDQGAALQGGVAQLGRVSSPAHAHAHAHVPPPPPTRTHKVPPALAEARLEDAHALQEGPSPTFSSGAARTALPPAAPMPLLQLPVVFVALEQRRNQLPFYTSTGRSTRKGPLPGLQADPSASSFPSSRKQFAARRRRSIFEPDFVALLAHVLMGMILSPLRRAPRAAAALRVPAIPQNRQRRAPRCCGSSGPGGGAGRVARHKDCRQSSQQAAPLDCVIDR